MPNQELLYKISADIFAELGDNFSESQAESLVARIYRSIEPYISAGGLSLDSSNRIVVSVFGKDHAGIVAEVTKILADNNCSVVDINQTVVNDKFAMVIIAKTIDANARLTSLKENFRIAGEKLGVRIHIQREDLFNAMHRI